MRENISKTPNNKVKTPLHSNTAGSLYHTPDSNTTSEEETRDFDEEESDDETIGNYNGEDNDVFSISSTTEDQEKISNLLNKNNEIFTPRRFNDMTESEWKKFPSISSNQEKIKSHSRDTIFLNSPETNNSVFNSPLVSRRTNPSREEREQINSTIEEKMNLRKNKKAHNWLLGLFLLIFSLLCLISFFRDSRTEEEKAL